MKIAFLNFYSGYRYRGGETFVHELAKRLVEKHEILLIQAGPRIEKEKYKTEVISGFTDPEEVGYVSRNNIFGRLFLDKQRRQDFVFSLKAIAKIRQFRPDVIIPLNGAWQALICSLYCRFTNSKLIIAGQSGPGWDDRFNLLIKPHLFVALTKRQRDWAEKATIWKQELALIPNGVNLTKFYPAVPPRSLARRGAGKKIKLNLEKPIIMTVAASTPDKRVEEGLRAVAALPRGSFLLLGKGPLDERINKLGYKLLGKKRFLHTAVPHGQMPEYYRAADLFTLCSVSSEAFGIVYLEAMASGLPVVATDDPSRREIVGDAGVFVNDPDDESEYPDALQVTLKKAWDDLPCKQAAKFSWDRIAKEYESVLAKLIRQ